MKNLKWLFLGLCFAQVAFAGPQDDGRLACYYEGKQFEMIVKDRRFYVVRDSVDISTYDNSLVLPFLEGSESSFQVNRSSLHLELAPGHCAIDEKNPTHIAHCDYTQNEDELPVNQSSLFFSFVGLSPSGMPQTTSVGRSVALQAVSLDINIVNKTDFSGASVQRAVVSVQVQALVGTETRKLLWSKDLGEWTQKVDRSNWDRCVVEPAQSF